MMVSPLDPPLYEASMENTGAEFTLVARGVDPALRFTADNAGRPRRRPTHAHWMRDEPADVSTLQ